MGGSERIKLAMTLGFVMWGLYQVVDSGMMVPLVGTAILCSPILILYCIYSKRSVSWRTLEEIAASLGAGWEVDPQRLTASATIDGQTVFIGPKAHISVTAPLRTGISRGGARFRFDVDSNIDRHDSDSLGPVLHTGDQDFDQAWVVHSHDTHRIRAILNHETRQYLHPSGRATFPPVSITLTEQEVSLRSDWHNRPSREWLLEAAKIAARIANIYDSEDAFRAYLAEIADGDPNPEVRLRASMSL